MEALAQLSIWLAAGFEKLLQLCNVQEKDLECCPLLPSLGWTVIGHDWHLYIALRGLFEGQDRIVSSQRSRVGYTLLTVIPQYIDGPIESVAASTRSYYGIFKLINLIHRASMYAEEVYWPWMCDQILSPVGRPDN